jgi:uncharacterized membrane protein
MPGRLVVVAVALAAIAWFLLVALAPELPPTLAAIVYAAGSLVCHQLPERSFHWHGAQLAVCARCTGIYLGTCSAAVLAPLPPSMYVRWSGSRRRTGWLLAAAAVPTVATVMAEWAGWWSPSSAVRAGTGVLLGVAGAVVVVAAFGSAERRH